MISIGIDPGINGAIAFIGDGPARVFDLPHHSSIHRLDGYALAMLMRSNAAADTSPAVWIEQLHGSSGHSGGAGTAQTGAMMQSLGIILGAVDCTRFPITMVTPQRWKGGLGLVEKTPVGQQKPTTTQRKAKSLCLARKLYPELQYALARQKDDGRAEALLIAHWGRGFA